MKMYILPLHFLFYQGNSLAGVTFLGVFMRNNLKILLPKLSNLVLIKSFFYFILTSAKLIEFKASRISCGDAGKLAFLSLDSRVFSESGLHPSN